VRLDSHFEKRFGDALLYRREMNRLRSLLGFGAFGVIGGGLSIWYGFRHQMCTVAGDVQNQCGPNFLFLIPGIILVLIGIGLLLMAYRHDSFSHSSNVDG